VAVGIPANEQIGARQAITRTQTRPGRIYVHETGRGARWLRAAIRRRYFGLGYSFQGYPPGAAGKRPPPSGDTASLQTVAAAGVSKAHRNSKTNRTNVVQPVMKPGANRAGQETEASHAGENLKALWTETFQRGTFVPLIFPGFERPSCSSRPTLDARSAVLRNRTLEP
jgi:hypothetical protein